MTTQPRILLVDDDHAPMCYFVESLKDIGCEVEQCSSVSEAIAYLASFGHMIEGVILDWMIPIGSPASNDAESENVEGGQLVLNHLKATHPGVPVLIFTNAHLGGRFDKEATPIRVLRKCDHSPSDLSDLVARHFGISIQRKL
jgi:CheY-like chemotaxis protein